MSEHSHDEFEHLDGGGRLIARLSINPAWTVYLATGAAVILAWFMIVAMGARSSMVLGDVSSGPGGALLRLVPSVVLPDAVEAFIAQCLTASGPVAVSFEGVITLWAMWIVMSVAMMLPSAAPLIKSYCEIADTAIAGNKPVIHPFVLISGYLAVWITAALLFSVLTALIQFAGWGSGSVAQPVMPIASAVALAIAGIYQFTDLKNACVEKCRNPFAVLFSNWRSGAWGVFKLGLEQGVYCVGCCWALMLVMFAVGIMNVLWMALLMIFTLFEKKYANRAISRLTGGFLLVWAAALLFIYL